jgi:hypothetical protein
LKTPCLRYNHRSLRYSKMDNRYRELLERATTGAAIPPDALARIRSQLDAGRFEEDPYTLIHILGEAGDRQSLPIIQKYIDYDTGDENGDALIRRIALQVIGRMWEVPEMFEVAKQKAFNDPSEYVRAAAATIIGFLGSRYPELKERSAATLLKGYERKNELDRYTWEAFYYGMLELLKTPVPEWPRSGSGLTQSQIREDVIDKVKLLAGATE